MYTLKNDERTTPVMLYTQESVIRGDVIVKESVMRVNIWLRTEGAPKYIHLLKAQVLVFGGAPVKPLSYPEIFYPTQQVIAFHTLPPTNEALDYDPDEHNRMMQPIDVLAGTFVMKGKIRMSTQTEVGVGLEAARIAWMSVYDVTVTNPYLPQMAPLSIPMALVNPNSVAFALTS